MKSRITGKPAKKKTVQEFIEELEMNEATAELENIQIREIVKSGKKKKVNSDTYYDHLDPSQCRFCMNYVFETDTCKQNMPKIDPWYTKDNNLDDMCEAWDYVYEIDDDINKE